MSEDEAGRFSGRRTGLAAAAGMARRCTGRRGSEKAAARSSVEKVFRVTAALIREGPLRMDSAHNGLIVEELLLPSQQGHVLMIQKARMFLTGNLPCEILALQPGLR